VLQLIQHSEYFAFVRWIAQRQDDRDQLSRSRLPIKSLGFAAGAVRDLEPKCHAIETELIVRASGFNRPTDLQFQLTEQACRDLV